MLSNRSPPPRPAAVARGLDGGGGGDRHRRRVGGHDRAGGRAGGGGGGAGCADLVGGGGPLPPGTLLLAVVLCRHGARSPLYTFPGDVRPLDAWGVGPGGLTPAGAAAHYALGGRLRSRYVDSGFLSPTWNVSEVYVRSTAIDRALLSAYAQMAGLYAGGNAAGAAAPGLPPSLQAVPIHSVAAVTDTLLLSGVACPRLGAIARAHAASPEMGALAEKHQRLLTKTLPAVLGVADGVAIDLPTVAAANDVWTASAADGVPLPAGATPSVVAEVRAVADALLAASVDGAEVQRLRAGVLLRALRDRAVAAAAAHAGRLPPPLGGGAAGAAAVGGPGGRHAEPPKAGAGRFAPQPSPPLPRYVLYSAHDTTLAAAAAALGFFDGTNPPYNSTVVVEVRSTGGAADAAVVGGGAGRRLRPADFSVRVEYNGVPQRVRGCAAVDCPLPLWVAGTSSRVLDTDDARVAACATGVGRLAAAVQGALGLRRAASPAEGGGGGSPPPRASCCSTGGTGGSGWRCRGWREGGGGGGAPRGDHCRGGSAGGGGGGGAGAAAQGAGGAVWPHWGAGAVLRWWFQTRAKDVELCRIVACGWGRQPSVVCHPLSSLYVPKRQQERCGGFG
ncbi:hypothetical protein BU14_0154s0031 [Porphyra umbilicalis]|uniref:Acid phosphatase n=1 Tax=Porphyra umbilicalis TaxID=2786 RepID=A0A1X6P953_PORUM|nr:hypothetical protein BU14_0154s0031 [Porphyra umbilicalis]|eukprot:OSX77255.1 hypothetical protein BU14_0154s0031 [Porphyra umbilicalis]